MAALYHFPTFVFGIIVVVYLATFVLFAILRILTGISIQRIGYLSFKRISYEPANGIKIEVRKLGLLLHRPTFAQPTWVSIVVSDSQLSVDMKKMADDTEKDDTDFRSTGACGRRSTLKKENGTATTANGTSGAPEKNRVWERARKLREKLKKLHKLDKWLQMVDIVFTNTNLNICDVGSTQIGGMTLLLDTRQKTADRNRMFDHCTDLKENQKPVEWMFTAKSVLFFPEKKKDPVEIMDHCMLNVYGVLEEEEDGIRDAAISVKFGRVNVPYDQIIECWAKLGAMRKPSVKGRSKAKSTATLGTLIEELPSSPRCTLERSRESTLESKEFMQLLLKGIKELQFAIGHLIISKAVSRIQPSGKSLKVVVGMKELGMDVHRLDQKSPAHRMYFSSEDIAHQALLAAISISVSVDDGVRQDKILYIPMVTMTTKTTLPSKMIQLVDKEDSDINANLLFANMVVTSPSIDLEPRHLPILLALIQSKSRRSSSGSVGKSSLISKLLPKASLNFSMHEPVIRILLPSSDLERPTAGDMLISSMSSVSAVAESSHEGEGENHYSLSCSFRITSHHLYYQACSCEKHDLLHTDTFDIRAQINAFPEVQVTAHAYLETFSLRLVRPEIVQGIKQMVGQFHRNAKSDKLHRPRISESPNFLRRLPVWVEHFRLEGRDFSMEVAGIDEEISVLTRGTALQLDSLTVEYRGRSGDGRYRPPPRRRITSRILTPDDTRGSKLPPTANQKNPTDGRKLTFHIRGLEGFMVDSEDSWEQDPFLNIPAFDISFSTSTDIEGPMLHVSSHAKSLFFHYSLYRHYSAIVATKVLREALGRRTARSEDDSQKTPNHLDNSTSAVLAGMDTIDSPLSDCCEHVNMDLKINHVRLKASMPEDPPMMLDIFGFDARRHKWGPPSLKARNVRLYAESPKVVGCWARLVSLRQFQISLRHGFKKVGGSVQEQKSIDLSADAIRLAVPHQLILYKVTDNIINTAKASQQMHHRLKMGTNEYVLEKKAVAASQVPRVSLRTKALLLELEDDPFETQLGIIYRLGLSEQKKRLARETAFDAKVKKMKENERRRSWETSRNVPLAPPKTANGASSIFRGRSRTWKPDSTVRAESPESRPKSAHRGRKTMRYNPEAAAGLSDESAVSIEDAWEKLQEHNSTAWIKRMKWAQEYHSSKMKESRELFYGTDEILSDIDETESILGLPMRPALMAGYFSDVEFVIDKPSFTMQELPKFMHRVGKGLPEDTQFSLLVPISLKLDFSEARVLLRDYPLPLIHVPRLRASQSARVSAWSLKADFVLAEELRDHESMRHCQVNIIPPSNGTIPEGGFTIDVRRTVSPVKSYSDFDIAINTSYATRVTWCTSYQPAIQDMMMVFETFTKPHFDPSERTGFWDKIRLVLHSHMSVAWKGDGDVHLTLKGSRDPYQITGNGAGFVMCWRGDVRWEIGRSGDPREFMNVDSEEYLLAIPDFSHQVRDEFDTTALPENRSVLSLQTIESTALFKKVIMKLSGRVRWLVGLMFEQELLGEDGQMKRSFKFRPHYDITLKAPSFAKSPPGKEYDAFRGFRSHYIHMSLSILSPLDCSPTPSNTKPSTSYNTIHLTPRFFTHFFSWWGLFSGVMSLPIRQGELWPGPEKSNKKFGRHLATIKYKLCLSPLFISHIYKHNDKDDAGNDVVAATGLKAKLDSFMVDIHQRREDTEQSTTMRINQAELDFHSADIRAVSAAIVGATADELMKQAAEAPLNLAESTIRYSGDMSQFTIPDGDYSWIDMDDFVELDWVLPSNKTPKTKIMPLAYTPRFTYFRQTDHGGSSPSSTSVNPVSPFGHEPTHDCLMSENNDPREIQCGLVQARLEKVNQQMKKNKEALGSLAQALKLQSEDVNLKSESEKLIEQSSILFNKLNFLQTMLRRMSSKLDNDDRYTLSMSDQEGIEESDTDSELLGMDSSPFDYVSDFDNRFIVHNMQAKWNNSLRNIILKYIHQVSQRRGFVYYMSRRAVKFILDIVEEQKNSGQETTSGSISGEYASAGPSSTPNDDSDDQLEKRIQELLKSEEKFVIADEKPGGGKSMDQTAAKLHREDLTGDVADEYVPQNSYHVRLIAPQIQMQSEKNKGAAVLVAAQGMQLKVVSIMDRDRIGDDVSGLVQRRFALNLDNTQFFVSQRQDFAHQSMSLHSANRYGAPTGTSWPPWVPLESMFDFRNLPVGFSRVVERTSATLRYDKYNSLRLKYSDQVSDMESGALNSKGGPVDDERRIDHVWVDFPRVEASCDSAQYFAMYIIVLDLLLYAEPLEKLRSEKLEKIMLASDFSDLTGAPEMVERLQSRIHQLEDIKTYFEINSRNLDIEGWQGRVAVDEDLASCEEELFFMMKAITTAQRKYEDRSSQASGILRWYLSASEIVWRLLRDRMDPLMDIRLKNAGYERMDNADGSNFNTVEVEMMRGYNLLPDAVYPEMIAPFLDQLRGNDLRPSKVLRVYWHMLEAIAGIPVMDHFEVNLFPLKIQLEREIGEKIFEYIFPGVGTSAFENGGFSPFLVHSMKPIPDDSGSDDSDDGLMDESQQMDDSSSTKSDGASPVELRLRPTLSLHSDPTKPEIIRPTSSGSGKARSNSFKASNSGSVFRGFKPSRTLTHKSSTEALSIKSRKSSEGPLPSVPFADKNKKLQIFHRTTSNERDEKRSDELSQMMSRASNYMTLAYIKIPSVVLCLSYKGRGESNFEDVHEFVFRMPMLEYRNKTWSNLDLAIRLKKDIIRALISHTGAILQNKLTHHRPAKSQGNIHRMMANNGSLGTASTFSYSDGDSSYDTSEFNITNRDPTNSRPSTSYSSYHLRPPSTTRPGTSMSSLSFRSTGSSGTSTFFTPPTGSPGVLPQASDGVDDKKNIFANNLGRLANLASLTRNREGIMDESEESINKKSRLLLGKKVFGGSS